MRGRDRFGVLVVGKPDESGYALRRNTLGLIGFVFSSWVGLVFICNSLLEKRLRWFLA
jgi:hypothetical protein